MEVREKKHQSVLISLNKHLLDTGLMGPIKYHAICTTCQTWTTSSGAKKEEGTYRKRRQGKRLLLLLSTAAWHLNLLGTTELLCASTLHARRSPEASSLAPDSRGPGLVGSSWSPVMWTVYPPCPWFYFVTGRSQRVTAGSLSLDFLLKRTYKQNLRAFLRKRNWPLFIQEPVIICTRSK